MAKPRALMLSQEVHPIPPLKGAAVEQWIYSVSRRLSGYEGHVVSVPHPYRPDEETADGVHFKRVRIGAAYNRLFRKLTRLDPYSYVDRVVRHARAIAPEIVHLHNAPQFADALIRKLPAARVILHMHNEKSDEVRSRIPALVGCSAYIRDWYATRGLLASRFSVLDNGVDVSAYPVRHSDFMHTMRRRHGIPEDRFILLYVGRISPEKGPDLAALAMRRLDPRQYHLVVVGEWPEGNPEKSERVRFAQELKSLLGCVPATVLGSIPPDEMPGIYALGDLLIIPSRFEEPFSMAAIEAMAAGLPVLAVRKGGMSEYMEDGSNAFLLDPNASAQEVAAAVNNIAQDRGKRSRIASAARMMVQARFDWSRVAAATERLYDEVRGQP
jgi:glycosyltransferase involved in cell wall biosynthesis